MKTHEILAYIIGTIIGLIILATAILLEAGILYGVFRLFKLFTLSYWQAIGIVLVVEFIGAILRRK